MNLKNIKYPLSESLFSTVSQHELNGALLCYLLYYYVAKDYSVEKMTYYNKLFDFYNVSSVL